MTANQIDLLIRSLELRDRLSDEEKSALRGAGWSTKAFTSGETIVEEDSRPTRSCLLKSGVAARCHYVLEGKRQISAIHIPGDFMDLHGFLLKSLDHGILALTNCEVVMVPHEALLRITEKFPHLTRLLWLNTAIDAAIHRAWVVTMGRHSALSQIAHFLCEMFTRYDAAGLTKGRSFRLELSQTQLSDCLGLSLVHVNRNLQELKKRGLIEWRDYVVEIKNWSSLKELADFDASYLSLVQQPR